MLSADFRIATSLPPREVLARLAKLFEKAGVTAERDATRVWSLQTPIPLTNADRRLYSRGNRIGINPFALITKVSASAIAAILFGICALLFRWSLSLLRYEVGQELATGRADTGPQ